MKFKQNDLIQSSYDPNKTGKIIKVLDDKKYYNSYYTVLYDNGTTEDRVSEYQVSIKDDEYAKEYRAHYREKSKLIDIKLKIAANCLDEAIELSEELGIPFSSNITFLYNLYIPSSIPTKFPGINLDLARNIIGLTDDYLDSGWLHSAIC